jgi:branched-chain amino acid aminotransferase
MYAYVNGDYVPEDQAKISIFDRGFTYGDSVFDSTRTFKGHPFKVEQHLERLRKSLNYMELNGAQIIVEARDAIAGVVERSKKEIDKHGDVIIFIYVTRGASNQSVLAGTLDEKVRPTLVVFLRRIDHAAMAPLYESGIDLGVSLTVKHFQGAIDPRVKSTNRLEAARGELKGVRAAAGGEARGVWTVVFGNDGSIAEAKGANLCLVEGRKIVRPLRYEALGGISLETLCELAVDLGLEVEERKFWLYDLINADEVLLSASSFQVLPVMSIDGIPLGPKRDIYESLLGAWFELAGLDFVADSQARAMRQVDTAIASASLAR